MRKFILQSMFIQRSPAFTCRLLRKIVRQEAALAAAACSAMHHLGNAGNN